MRQTCQHLFLTPPRGFGFNADCATTNAFSSTTSKANGKSPLMIFYRLLNQLSFHQIRYSLLDGPCSLNKPDAVFLNNNWFLINQNQWRTLYLCPMYHDSRKHEYAPSMLKSQLAQAGYPIDRCVDWRWQSHALEGTGSMVFAHPEKRVFACLSPRTHPKLFEQFCKDSGYQGICFEAHDENGQPIYHTNVLLSIAPNYALVVTEALNHPKPLDELKALGKRIIPLSFSQMKAFAGNVLCVRNQEDKPIILMSERARHALDATQLRVLGEHGTLVSVDLGDIEVLGGGSMRCMLAEVF